MLVMRKKIKILARGPYEVTKEIPLSKFLMIPDETGIPEKWEKQEMYSVTGEKYYLCRCGRSKNQPFCDGAHEKMNFDGECVADKTPYLEKARHYVGVTVDLLDDPDLCAVARFCDRAEGTWDAVMRPENAESEKLAIEESNNCSSGRLTILKKDGTLIEPKLEKEIGVVQDIERNHRGPLWVKGGIVIEDDKGEEYEIRNRVTLCRCGESSNMPFCDASHLICPHMKGLDK